MTAEYVVAPIRMWTRTPKLCRATTYRSKRRRMKQRRKDRKGKPYRRGPMLPEINFYSVARTEVPKTAEALLDYTRAYPRWGAP
jgi:hypothetical protein